jgi:outer membrane protein OmpA-like peptidoglycan-associated protein
MRRLAILATSLVFATIALGADTPVPAADLVSAKDPASLGRFTGSTMLTYTGADYDSLTIPLDVLKPVPGQRDGSNNAVHAPSKKLELEGRRQHFLYLLPEGASPLAAVRNYQNAAKSKGGKTLYECQGTACGGGQRTVNSGGGGNQSIGMLLWPSDKVIDKHTSAAGCAMRNKITEQRFTALEIPAGSLHAAVLAFGIEASAECKNFNGRTFVMVDTLESKAMAQTMDTPSANDMVASITTSGRVALYGILFDSGKTDVKPESKATMDEIAKLLSANRSLKLLVVGHTDNVGGFAPNLELSKRRAEAVVAQLVSQYKIDAKRLQAFGVSYASPVAANTDEAGRGRNRRVELVAN